MFDEYAFIARLEAADTEELAQMVARPAIEEEKALRAYLSDERYQRLHSLALRREMMQSLRTGQRRTEKSQRADKDRDKEHSRNVIIIPGILGSELTSYDKNGTADRIWLDPRRIVTGDMTRLRLDANGLNDYDPRYTVRVTGIMKRFYGELMLTLGLKWNVHAFWYDWRKDMNITAAQLHARINALFPSGEPVQIVAHSVGGLVARTYLHNYDQHWERIGRLVMLGTPNHGLYTAPLALTGQLDIIREIEKLDPQHDSAEIQEVVSSFPGFYQLLPSPFRNGKLDEKLKGELYKSSQYEPWKVSQQHLNHACAHHEKLESIVDPLHMIYIGGYGQQTIVDLAAGKLKFDSNDPLKGAIRGSLDGDGSVPRELGMLYTNGAKEQVPALFARTSHDALNSHPKVLAAIDALLRLPIPIEKKELRSQLNAISDSTDLKLSLEKQQRPNLKALTGKQSRMRREQSGTENGYDSDGVAPEDNNIGELLSNGFVVGYTNTRTVATDATLEPPEISLELLHGDITALDKLPISVDVIAIGHYRGDQPQGMLHRLDEVLSQQFQANDGNGATVGSNRLLSELAERGTIRAELADIFLVNDPRLTRSLTIAVAGKGVPGRFSAPELTVLVRELCWTLGRLGKRHLATALIGGGRDTASVSDAVSAWVRGIKNAITGVDPSCVLEKITVIEIDPTRVLHIDTALKQQRDYFHKKNRLELHYQKLREPEREKLKDETEEYFLKEIQPTLLRQLRQSPETLTPMRVTVGLEGGTYVFGAVSHIASIPEREIPLDPNLVAQANDEIAAERDPERQLQLGQFMERLLIPDDLRNLFTTPAPIVMTVDATTARIHWEMLAQTDPAMKSDQTGDADDRNQYFLGISRGFTRQLRTRFAPLPQPPPPTERILRVLVVADPAADAHLPGAEEEGVAVADLFEHFNVAHPATINNRIEVVRLFGPREATRTAVLRHLMMRRYDLLHFAGHCIYDKQTPSASGWIFTNSERISANELRRIDRVPMFIFSNACESGITPARASERSVDLAPSFAEAFFAQGVANFVCTAWPVDDRAARSFALTLYAGLLGLDGNDTNSKSRDDSQASANPISIDLDECKPSVPKPIFWAMRNARNAIAQPPNDRRTWGAYQHYGDPYFRLFDPSRFESGARKDTLTNSEQKSITSPSSSARREIPKEMVAEQENEQAVIESELAAD